MPKVPKIKNIIGDGFQDSKTGVLLLSLNPGTCALGPISKRGNNG
jgi:hypothetical protein